MIQIIICLVIVLLIYNMFVTTIEKECTNENITIEKLYGSKIDDLLSNDFGMVKIILDREIPCGIYEAMTHIGSATMIIGKDNKNEAMVIFFNRQKLKTIERFEFWNINRITKTTNDIINTLNNGCC